MRFFGGLNNLGIPFNLVNPFLEMGPVDLPPQPWALNWRQIETVVKDFAGPGLTFGAYNDPDLYSVADIVGTDGDDLLETDPQSGKDFIAGGDGNDTIVSWDGRDRLFGNDGDDAIFAGAQRDYLDGGNGNDVLFGDGHRDILIGGAGHDFLNGGTGNDTLIGGTEGDLFYLSEGRDKILDFSVAEGDKLGAFTLGLTEEQVMAALEESGRREDNTLDSLGLNFRTKRDGDVVITAELDDGHIARTRIDMEDGELSFDLFVF